MVVRRDDLQRLINGRPDPLIWGTGGFGTAVVTQSDARGVFITRVVAAQGAVGAVTPSRSAPLGPCYGAWYYQVTGTPPALSAVALPVASIVCYVDTDAGPWVINYALPPGTLTAGAGGVDVASTTQVGSGPATPTQTGDTPYH